MNKKILPLLITIILIFLYNSIIISPIKKQNKSIKEQIEKIELGEEDNLENHQSITEKNNEKKDYKIETNFYKSICNYADVLYVENHSENGSKKYLIGLRKNKNDLNKFIKYMNDNNISVSIEKIKYKKSKVSGEYSILVNLF